MARLEKFDQTVLAQDVEGPAHRLMPQSDDVGYVVARERKDEQHPVDRAAAHGRQRPAGEQDQQGADLTPVEHLEHGHGEGRDGGEADGDPGGGVEPCGVCGANRSSVNAGGFLVSLGGGFFGSGTGGAQPRWSRATLLKVP